MSDNDKLFISSIIFKLEQIGHVARKWEETSAEELKLRSEILEEICKQIAAAKLEGKIEALEQLYTDISPDYLDPTGELADKIFEMINFYKSND